MEIIKIISIIYLIISIYCYYYIIFLVNILIVPKWKKNYQKTVIIFKKITISKINLQESNNVSSLNKNNNNGNLSKRLQKPNQKRNRRYLTDCSKRESRPIAHISTNNHNNNGDNCEEDLDDNEFMGMRKKTFDPGKGAGKIIWLKIIL